MQTIISLPKRKEQIENLSKLTSNCPNCPGEDHAYGMDAVRGVRDRKEIEKRTK